MLSITITSANQTVNFEYPESVTHRVLGEDYTIDLTRVCEDGWKALLAKSRRQVSDGSPDSDTVFRKIDQLYGIGKPIGTRTSRDPVAGALASIITKKLVKDGFKVKDVPKLGTTVEVIKDVALQWGITASWFKKALKRAQAIAELEAQEIE